ncbi:SAM-dependent methyltransferase [Porphyromonas sp.]|uniref:SAM-dependent methyltransferase n=1 Tax=Porphyromonas sp. TaxID=1924944 RepID=UPI0026DD6FA8|nr:SAM-dependent methyltransferase [Porphyromonas sp.]MDO4695552.1 SAM-dependent methyltransferase [Porphyromonas sp.]MDO4771359.1 SAM-dependent methyltransferase [Porphyromonas sp.]
MIKGKLYLIPISLGISPTDRYQPLYNLQVLSGLKVFIVENAKTARQYIKSVLPESKISELTIYEIDKHNGYVYPAEVMQVLLSGTDIGLMSEAGCPAVADPGSLIVREAHQKGIQVVPLIGPSSILLSLMASGFSGQRFTFLGYLPIDEKKRKSQFTDMIHRVREHGETQIFIETPYRNDKMIAELCKTLPDSIHLCVAIDLTTENEEIHSHSIKEWKKIFSQISLHKRPAIFLIG